MRVGVAGASGFIGSTLCAALAERGDDVVVFIRPDSPTRPEAIRHAAVVRWNPKEGDVDETDLHKVGGLDVLVNLAGVSIGEGRWTPKRKEAILRSRLDSTALVMALAARVGVGLVANASAIGYYGSRGDTVLDESAAPGTGFLADVCRQWEEVASTKGVAVAHLRSGIVMSSLGGALVRQLPLFRAGVGGALGDGSQWMSPISLGDEVRAITWVIDRHLEGPINLVAPCALTNRDFTTALARALRRPALFRVPRVALEVALGKEAARELVLTSQRVAPVALMDDGFRFAHGSIEEILSSVLERGASSAST